MRILLEISCIVLGWMLYHKKYRPGENRDGIEQRIGYWMSILFVAIGCSLLLWSGRPQAWSGLVPLSVVGVGGVIYIVYNKYKKSSDTSKIENKDKNTYYIEQVLGNFCQFAIGILVIADIGYHVGENQLQPITLFSLYEFMMILILPVIVLSFMQLRAYVQQNRYYKMSHREKMSVFKKKLNSSYEKL